MVLSALIPSIYFSFLTVSLLISVERSSWVVHNIVNMQQIRFNYSLKNIGLPSHDEYTRNIIDKSESVINRMRWKAHFFLNSSTDQQSRQPTYGLKSKLNPPHIPELKRFEEDIAEMIENIRFERSTNELIKTLEADKKRISSSKNVFVPADKTRNLYEMSAQSYKKLLTENVTKTYKQAADKTYDSINRELKVIARDLNISIASSPWPKLQHLSH